VERRRKPARLPSVLTRDEAHKLFVHLHGMPRLTAGLLHGRGLRLMSEGVPRKDAPLPFARPTDLGSPTSYAVATF